MVKRCKSDLEKKLDQEANETIKKEVKVEMAKYGVGYREVAKRLTEMGRPISEGGLRNKISLGTHETRWYKDFLKAIRQKT